MRKERKKWGEKKKTSAVGDAARALCHTKSMQFLIWHPTLPYLCAGPSGRPFEGEAEEEVEQEAQDEEQEEGDEDEKEGRGD